MADGLNNNWLILLGLTGGMMTVASGMIYHVANRYNRALKQVQTQKTPNNVLEQMKEGSSNSDYKMVTGMLLSREAQKSKEESKVQGQFAKRFEKASKCKVLFSNETYCEVGTNTLLEVGMSSFKNGDFNLMDVKHPTSRNQIRVDAQSGNFLCAGSVPNKRKDFFKNDSLCERVKHYGAEGFTLTMIGKISYDVSKDEFSMNEPIAMIGGGLQEAVNLLYQRYQHMAQVAQVLFWLGATFLSIFAFSMYRRYRQMINRQRIEGATQALTERQPQLQRSTSQLEKCAVECKICMSAVANVVMAPCNHLIMCQDCYKDMVNISGSSSLSCPLCRVEVDFEEVFYLSKTL